MPSKVEVSVLPTGLTVITERVEDAATVAMGAYVSAGGRNETAAETGVAHFIGRLAFSGTSTRSATEISDLVETIGGQINRFSTREQTGYQIKLVKEFIPQAANLLSDILINQAFDPAAMEAERSLILQEIAISESDPVETVFRRFQATAFPAQPLGWSPMGCEEVIGAVNAPALEMFTRLHFTPRNTVVTAAGNVDHHAFVEIIEDQFSPYRGDFVIPPMPAEYLGGECQEFQAIEQAHVVLGFEASSLRDQDYYAAQVLSLILGDGRSSRLSQEIMDRLGLVYTINAFLEPWSDVGVLGVYARTSTDEVPEVITAISNEIAKVQDDITDLELTMAKRKLRTSTLIGLESTTKRIQRLASEWHVHGEVLPVAEVLTAIEAVTIDQVMDCAFRVFRKKPTLSSVGPTRQISELTKIMSLLAF